MLSLTRQLRACSTTLHGISASSHHSASDSLISMRRKCIPHFLHALQGCKSSDQAMGQLRLLALSLDVFACRPSSNALLNKPLRKSPGFLREGPEHGSAARTSRFDA